MLYGGIMSCMGSNSDELLTISDTVLIKMFLCGGFSPVKKLIITSTALKLCDVMDDVILCVTFDVIHHARHGNTHWLELFTINLDLT